MNACVGSQADKMNDAVKSMNDLLDNMPKVDKSFEVAKANTLNSLETNRITNERMINAYFAHQKRGLAHDSSIDK